MIYVLDADERVVATLNNDVPRGCPYTDDLLKERLEDALMTYEFTVPADHDDSIHLTEDNYIVRAGFDNELLMFQIVRVEENHDDKGLLKYVYCEYSWNELNGTIIRPNSWYGIDAETAMNNALADTRWRVGIVEWFETADFEYSQHITSLKMLQDIRESFEGDLRFRVEMKNGQVVGRYVDLLQRRGEDSGVMFTYDKNLKGIRRIHDRSSIVTALIGVGKGNEEGESLKFTNYVWSKAGGDPADKPAGQDYIGDNDALQRWGLNGEKHIMGVYEYDTTSAKVLISETWKELQRRKNGVISYEVNALIRERIPSLEFEKIRIGDTVRGQDLTFIPYLMIQARVLELERSFTDPTRDAAVFGEYREIYSRAPQSYQDIMSTLRRQEAAWSQGGGAEVIRSTTPPADTGAIWIDSSRNDASFDVVKTFNPNTQLWEKNAATTASDVGAITENEVIEYAQKRIYRGSNIPTDAVFGDLWIDERESPNIIRQYDGLNWIALTNWEFSNMVGAITGNQIFSDAVTREKIKDLEVTAAELGNSSVQKEKIYNLAVGTAAIDNLAVQAAKIDNLAINRAHIQDLEITSGKLALNSIETKHISATGISADVITGGIISGVTIDVGTDLTVGNNIRIAPNNTDMNVSKSIEFFSGNVNISSGAGSYGLTLTASEFIKLATNRLQIGEDGAFTENMDVYLNAIFNKGIIVYGDITAYNISGDILSGDSLSVTGAISGGSLDVGIGAITAGSATLSGSINASSANFTNGVDANFIDLSGWAYVSDIRPYSGSTMTMNGQVIVSANGNALRLQGTDHAYIEFYENGASGGRGAYMGFVSGTSNEFHFVNSRSGNIVMSPPTSYGVGIYGNSTLYFPNYGVGIFANNTTWLKSYLDKGFYTYAEIRGTAFTTISGRKNKKDITEVTESFIDKVKNTKIYKYKYQNDKAMLPPDVVEEGPASSEPLPEPRLKYGLLADEAPSEVLADDHDAVDLYAMISLLWRAVQELSEQIPPIGGITR